MCLLSVVDFRLFQSTRPLRGATCPPAACTGARRNFNPRAPYGARPSRWPAMLRNPRISIHAPLTGHDVLCLLHTLRPHISIHVPRTGHDNMEDATWFHTHIFQSTRPLRGATFGIHSPSTVFAISIHAPLTGRDRRRSTTRLFRIYFNPRAPCGARLLAFSRLALFMLYFNPRAPYGARLSTGYDTSDGWNFNPRAPYGARLPAPWTKDLVIQFQSTRPLRGATSLGKYIPLTMAFQSTRPLRGATRLPVSESARYGDFNPRAPYGARLDGPDLASFHHGISIHAPLTGRDRCRKRSRRCAGNFNPRAPYGARRLRA